MAERSSRFVSGVVLAAGGSSRLGRPKQLLPLGGEPLLAQTVKHALASRLGEVVLVLGHAAGEIAAAVGERGQRTVVNADYGRGQSTSMRAGLAALAPGAEAALFLLGDQPRVGPAIIDALVAAFEETRGPIVVPLYGGEPGTPVLIARALFPELLAVEGDQGARGVVRAHPAETVRVPVGDGPPPRDVDTEEDYHALVAAWPGVG